MDETQPFNDGTTSWMLQGQLPPVSAQGLLSGDGVGVDKARKICSGCPVTERCLSTPSRAPHRPWCVGRLQQARRAAAHPQAATSLGGDLIPNGAIS